jgi:CHAT domain-containing protein/tetratricopeptide (TPR) repeat protein
MKPGPFNVVLFVALLLVTIPPNSFKSRYSPTFSEATARTAAEEVARLQKGTPLINRAADEKGSLYELNLLSGQYVQVVFRREGDLNLSVTAYGPDGRRLIEIVSRRYGDMDLSLIAEASGAYRLAVRSLEKDSVARHYDVEIEELRTAIAEDKNLVVGEASFAEAEKLRTEWKEGELRRAIEKYREAVAQWDIRNRERAVALQSIGEIYFIFSEYSSALAYFRKAQVQSRFARDKATEIEALNNIGYSYVYQGQNSIALPYFKKALEYSRVWQREAQANRIRRGEAQALNNMGEVFYSLGDLKKALNIFNSALPLWLAAGDRRGQALSHLNIGYTYYDMGDTQAAADHYQQSLTLWLAIDEQRGEAQSRTALGGVYSFVGERKLALDSHGQALKIFLAISDLQGKAAALNGIGRIYEESNDTETALDNYDQALQLYQKIGNRDYEALTECYVGRVYRSRENYPLALDHYHSSVAKSRAVGDQRIEAYALKEIATIYSAKGENNRALEWYTKVLRLYRNFGDRRGQAQTLNNIGLTYQSLGHWKKALGYHLQALPLNRAGADRGGEAATRYNIARAARASNLLNESLSQIKNSIDIIEALRSHIASYELRSSYFALMHEYYGFYIDVLMQLHQQNPAGHFNATALETSESARARSLLEILTDAKANLREGVSAADLLEREAKLQQQLNTRAKYHLRLMNSKRTEDQAVEVEREIHQLTTEYQEVEARIRDQNPRYAALTQPQLLRVEDVQKNLLDDQTILLEYALGNDKSYLWVVTANSLDSHELPGRSEVEAAARDLYRLLTARQPVSGDTIESYQKRVADSDKQYWIQASSLSQMLLGQVGEKLSNKRLLIVADGALQYIPFEALPAPRRTSNEPEESGDAAPLVIEHEIISLPSASALASLREGNAPQQPPAKIVAVLADPVFEPSDPRVQKTAGAPGALAAAEAKAGQLADWLRGAEGNKTIPRLPATLLEGKTIIATTPGYTGTLMSGFGANRLRVMSGELANYQIVHFATHGVINSEHPELSGIILSMVNEQGVPENGFLQLHDIYNLKLSAGLVVLSACNTGLGKDVKGEGLVGLTRGFMYAGSKSTIASLWKVDDDATAELMGHFYNALLQEGKPPAAALKKAKEAMWAQKRWHQPYYWAAFILQGEYKHNITTRNEALSTSMKAMLLAAVLLSLIGVLLAAKLIKKHNGLATG